MAVRSVHPKHITAEPIITRERDDPELVESYAESMRRGDKFPPGCIFVTPEGEKLVAGRNRVAAGRIADVRLDIDYKTGSVEEAERFAYHDNSRNGARLTPADKRRNVKTALSKYPDWADRRLADHCDVSNHLVAQVRSELVNGSTGTSPSCQKLAGNTRVSADGKRRPARKTVAAKTAKPPKPGSIKGGDVRVWDRWLDLFGKLKRATDEVEKEFPHPINHRNTNTKLNEAIDIVMQWRRATRQEKQKTRTKLDRFEIGKA